MSRPAIALLAWMSCAAAVAQDVHVVSPRPDSVSITIYRDLVALITETRTVDLPADAVTLEFAGVVDSLIPQSALVNDTGRAVTETNYDYGRLSTGRLLANSIGRQVWLTRTNPATGKATQVAATLITASRDSVVFRTVDGNEALHCSGLPERLSFEEIPGELRNESRLSIRLAAGTPGKRQVRVSYIATGFSWNADYVGHLAASGDRMGLDGWVTLENLGDTSFRNAEVNVVAGRLNLLDADEDRGSGLFGTSRDYETEESVASQREWKLEELRSERDQPFLAPPRFSACYPYGPPVFPRVDARSRNKREAVGIVASDQELYEVVVTGLKQSMAVRENLADYQMYRLPGRTDLNARQTKQVAFLAKPDVKIDRFYGVRLAKDEQDMGELEEGVPAIVKVAWKNVAADGLGEPLPSGIARFFESGEHGAVFVGDAKLRDSPVGTPIELGIGRTNDLDVRIANMEQADVSVDSIDSGAGAFIRAILTHRAYIPLSLRIVNAKSRPVTFELRQGPLDEFLDLRVKNASPAPQRKAGDYLWRVTVPANAETVVSYRVGGKLPSLDD